MYPQISLIRPIRFMFTHTWIMMLLSIADMTLKWLLNFTNRIEQSQYSAALAVACVWRGTTRQNLCNELGWKTLYHRWLRRLCHFLNLRNTDTPPYLYAELPTEKHFIMVLEARVIMIYLLVRRNDLLMHILQISLLNGICSMNILEILVQ